MTVEVERRLDRINVVVRVDASDRIGGGHVLRCLTLADALAANGARVTFVAARMLPFVAQRILAAGHALVAIDPHPELVVDREGWDRSTLPPAAQQRDAAATLAAAGAHDWIVVDHYRLDGSWEAVARSGRLLVIDDLANRSHCCDILIDQTFGRDPSDYTAWTEPGCTLLCGSRYAMLRSEFALARPEALIRRSRTSSVTRLLISLGSTDVGGITQRVMAAMNLPEYCAIDVVVSTSAPSLPALRHLAAHNRSVALHINSGNMHELMAAADLAIGAAGMTSWERCCLGLPSLTFVIADNQSFISERLTAAGAQLPVSWIGETSLTTVADRVFAGEIDLRQMSDRAAAIVDGAGVSRVVDHIATMDRGII